jgi:hypothetical protein
MLEVANLRPLNKAYSTIYKLNRRQKCSALKIPWKGI